MDITNDFSIKIRWILTRSFSILLRDGILSLFKQIYKRVLPDSPGGLVTPILGLLYGYIILKKEDMYCRYTLKENVFGTKKCYFTPPIRYAKKFDEIDKYKDRYYNNDTVYVEPDDTVMIIGVRFGITTQLPADTAKKVIGIEASPRSYKCAKKNIISNNIDLYQYAVWNESKEMELHYAKVAGDDSLIEPSNKSQQDRSVTVQAYTIEEIAQKLDIDTVDFLKVHVEGAEPEVIESIGNLRVNKIAVNINNERHGESPEQEVRNILSELGYETIEKEGMTLFGRLVR